MKLPPWDLISETATPQTIAILLHTKYIEQTAQLNRLFLAILGLESIPFEEAQLAYKRRL
ncbi:MAG: hypothetical protein HC840_30940 [Leptolyngbyaceae cyanobacterium RM2_2_4]|nr:hypothetical protein [Leptolyngbyaceae cyanobacterium SM1_4_3]NJO53080.1 hypothetical protein [Leptolyngbyaceae cyanobacterium RM2_2_4]